MREPSLLQRLLRERALDRYLTALERGNIDSIIAMLERAEHDPVLERMILEVHESYQTEEEILALLQEENEMEFDEGIHKSAPAGQMLEPEVEPAPARRLSKYTHWFQVLAAVLLVAIISGGFIFIQALRNPHSAPTAQTQHGWCEVQVTGLDTSQGKPQINSIDAVSANDIWIAGYLASQSVHTTSQTLIEHWNGKSLSITPSPNSGETGDRLRDVVEVSPNDVWAVGAVLSAARYANTPVGLLPGIHTLLEHWDGSQWNIVPSPDGTANGSNELGSIAAVSADDIWAVGYTAEARSSQQITQQRVNGALIEHWDGAQWSLLHLPDSFHAALLQKVIAPSKDDIWASGYAQNTANQNFMPLLVHWDGHQWSQVSGLDQDQGLSLYQNFSLYSLQASTPHDIWLTGQRPALLSNPTSSLIPAGPLVIEHWDGVSLQRQALPPLPLQSIPNPSNPSSPPLSQVVASVSVHATNDIWVAGGQSGFATVATNVPVFIQHWNGQNWQAASLPQEQVGQLSALAVVGGKVWAAGMLYKGLQQIPDQLVETTC